MRDGPGTARRASVKVILSYVLDWVMVIIIIAIGGALTLVPGNHRAFSLADPDISFPMANPETISTAVLVIVVVVVPAVLTLLIVLIFIPGPTVPKSTPKSLVWKRKLWEWNTAWLGLALSHATALFIVDGMKILFGRPRPDLLSRCQPDLDHISDYIVGGFGDKVLQGQYLVDWHICQQTDKSILADGFMSFPSGHNASSWAGLGYLSLFICAKFAISIPYLLPAEYTSNAFSSQASPLLQEPNRDPNQPHSKDPLAGPGTAIPQHRILRSTAAAPPLFLYVLPFIPVSAAIYIGATRFTDYRHHGFDIIFGSLIGMLSAYLAFYWYHAPIRRGAGWSWGPRSSDKAFAVGVGVQAWSGPAEWRLPGRSDDLEAGTGRATGLNGSVTPENPVAHDHEGGSSAEAGRAL